MRDLNRADTIHQEPSTTKTAIKKKQVKDKCHEIHMRRLCHISTPWIFDSQEGLKP